MTATVATETTFPEGWTGPCGECACEKYADCAYCFTCIEQSPWAAQQAEAVEAFLWEIEHDGSLGDWLYGSDL